MFSSLSDVCITVTVQNLPDFYPRPKRVKAFEARAKALVVELFNRVEMKIWEGSGIHGVSSVLTEHSRISPTLFKAS